MLLLWTGEECVFLPAWEHKHRAPDVFWGSSCLAHHHDVSPCCDFRRGERIAPSGYCCCKRSSIATLAPSVTVRRDPYQSVLACRQWPVCQVSLWCCAGVTFCHGVAADGSDWVFVALALLLAPACWAQASLRSAFWEEWQILGTSKMVFKSRYKNKLIPAAPLGWQRASCSPLTAGDEVQE